MLGVSHSGFYGFLRRQPHPANPQHEETVAMVKALAETSEHTDGSQRMSRALKRLGYDVGRLRPVV
jgi:putative transposase